MPILTYHSLDDSGSVISTPPRLFRDQVAALRERGYQGLTLGELLDGWDGRSALPPRPVVIAFDDGYRNVLEHAGPVLQDAGFRATVFAVAGLLGNENTWDHPWSSIPRLPLLSTGELRELGAAGFEVGAHGVTHACLTDLGSEAAEREIVGSGDLLAEAVGQPVTVFAYPYGKAGPDHRRTAQARYRAACGTSLARAEPGQRYLLSRIDAYYLRDPRAFRLLGTAAGELYVVLRALGRSGRALAGRWLRRPAPGSGRP
ncbi:MAG TPA: polysaccharide deacetylase family protein [Vicinamibacteria bacterium]|nr:polysaccharide deacetylase family protein [Vicinamibacteria bacterium]